jgi:hypothetical protein
MKRYLSEIILEVTIIITLLSLSVLAGAATWYIVHSADVEKQLNVIEERLSELENNAIYFYQDQEEHE